MDSSRQLQFVKLHQQRHQLFNEHSNQIDRLEKKYNQYIQEILTFKAKLLHKMNLAYYDALNKINEELCILSGGDAFKDIETLLFNSTDPNAQNTNNSDRESHTTLQSIFNTLSDPSIQNQRSLSTFSIEHRCKHSDTSSVSSDESISSSESESNSYTNNCNRINNASIISSMNMDQDTDDNDNDNDNDDDEEDRNTNDPIEYDLASNEWLQNVIKNKHNHVFLNLLNGKQETITLNFESFKHEGISSILERLNMYGLFERCKHIVIISPPKSIVKHLYQLIGTLSNIESIHFEKIPFLPTIKLLNKIPEHTRLEHMSLCDIQIKCAILYPEQKMDETEKEIDHVIGIIVSCKSLTISKWSNPHRFWSDYIAKFKKRLTHFQAEITGALREKIERCNLKKLVFLGGEPKQDDIPHSIMQLLFKQSASNLEILSVDFVDKNLYHACMPWLNQKNINKNLRFDSLKLLRYVWSDDRSCNLLKIAAKTAQNLNKITLVLPKSDLIENSKNKALIKQLEKRTKIETLTA